MSMSASRRAILGRISSQWDSTPPITPGMPRSPVTNRRNGSGFTKALDVLRVANFPALPCGLAAQPFFAFNGGNAYWRRSQSGLTSYQELGVVGVLRVPLVSRAH